MATMQELYQELYDNARKIGKDGNSLSKALTEDDEADINDWKNIQLINSDISNFISFLNIYRHIFNANHKLRLLNDRVQSLNIEDGDSVLKIQKIVYSARNNLKEVSDVVKEYAEFNLETSKTSRMNDHRCQRFMARMEDYFEFALESIKKMDDEMFDIEDED